jgi:hypothetical protein
MSRELVGEYIDKIEQCLLNLSNVYVEQFSATILTPTRANLRIRVRFQGRCLLSISEAFSVSDRQIVPIDYRYHFQDEQTAIIFRYDSTPHFPDLPTFPHHKHLPDEVVAANKPDIFQVIQEANEWISH